MNVKATRIQTASVIVHAHREQARSYMGVLRKSLVVAWLVHSLQDVLR
jgi:hypothetical protein